VINQFQLTDKAARLLISKALDKATDEKGWDFEGHENGFLAFFKWKSDTEWSQVNVNPQNYFETTLSVEQKESYQQELMSLGFIDNN
jgi:hypothetical protein